MTPLVTAINEKYFPGLVALNNSYRQNAGEGFELYCIVDGDADLFARVEDLGVKTITATQWAEDYPVSPEWPDKIPALFARLQIPRLFPNHKRAIWIDADCVIVKPITELIDIEFDEPISACTPVDSNGNPSPNYELGFVLRQCPLGLEKKRVAFTGLIVFNIAEWNHRGLTERCAKAMLNEQIVFRYGDQSVLAYVLMGDFHLLPMYWQIFANRGEAIPPEGKILHWVGPSVPWLKPMAHQKKWEEYGEVVEAPARR